MDIGLIIGIILVLLVAAAIILAKLGKSSNPQNRTRTTRSSGKDSKGPGCD